ncbi:MAG: hypothetical protein ACKOSQ_02895 [Planctomycetaceae bacterium]
MDTVTPRYVVDEHRTPTDVVLTIEEWRRVLEKLEELDDIRTYDEARSSAQESAPLDEVARQLRAGRSS